MYAVFYLLAKREYLEQFHLHFVVMANKNGSFVSRLQRKGVIMTFFALGSYQNSRIHEAKNRFSGFYNGFYLFSRITKDIGFTISRTLFFHFTIFTNEKSAFTTSRNPLGGLVNDILNSENLKSLFSSFLLIFGHFSEYRLYPCTRPGPIQ